MLMRIDGRADVRRLTSIYMKLTSIYILPLFIYGDFFYIFIWRLLFRGWG